MPDTASTDGRHHMFFARLLTFYVIMLSFLVVQWYYIGYVRYPSIQRGWVKIFHQLYVTYPFGYQVPEFR